MLFNSKNQQIAAQIEQVEAQIKALQEQLKQLQAYQQQVTTVETACSSVLTQFDTAWRMLQEICPDQAEVFLGAIAARTRAVAGLLPETQDAADDSIITPMPNDGDEPVENITTSTLNPIDAQKIDEGPALAETANATETPGFQLVQPKALGSKLTAKQQEVIDKLKQVGSIPTYQCTTKNGYHGRTIQALIQKGLVEQRRLENGELHYAVVGMASH